MKEEKKESPIGTLWGWGKPYHGKFIGSIILAVLGVACQMVPYFCVAHIVTLMLSGERDFFRYIVACVIALCGYLGKVIFSNLSTTISHTATYYTLRDLRENITAKLARVPMGTILDTPSGQYKTTIVDRVEGMEPTFAHLIPEMTANVLVPLVIVVYLFFLDWRMALLSLVTLVVGLAVMSAGMKNYPAKWEGAVKAGKQMANAIVEYIGGIEVVKAFSQSAGSYKKYSDAVNYNANYYVDWMRENQKTMSAYNAILPSVLICVLPCGFAFWISGSLELSVFLSIVIFSLGLIGPIIAAFTFTDDLAVLGTNVEEISQLLNAEELHHKDMPVKLADTNISLNHVSFSYDGVTEVLHDVSLAIRPGSMTAFVGPSGSGKSTFTNRIKKRFGDDVVVLYHDNYYRRQDGIPFEERVKVNYDHPDSLETDLLVEHLKELKAGKTIECPVYDYSQHNRSDKVLKIEPRPVILVEGILLLADPRIRDLLDIKVYVEADADERILRRISRDVEERGRDLNGIIDQYLTTVKPMHYLYVEPTRAKADIVINSGKNNVAFDLFVSKIGQLLKELKK